MFFFDTFLIRLDMHRLAMPQFVDQSHEYGLYMIGFGIGKGRSFEMSHVVLISKNLKMKGIRIYVEGTMKEGLGEVKGAREEEEARAYKRGWDLE